MPLCITRYIILLHFGVFARDNVNEKVKRVILANCHSDIVPLESPAFVVLRLNPCAQRQF